MKDSSTGIGGLIQERKGRYRLFKTLSLLLFLLSGIVTAATPVSDLNDLPAQSFSGEQFCFDAPLTNTGTPGFGPYLRLKLPPELSFDSASFLGAGVSAQVVGTFPPDLIDPIDGETVTGPAGYTLITLQPPIGSLVAGAPALNITICSTIDQNATIGAPLDVHLTPVLKFGDTATGDNGPIAGTEAIAPVTPTLVIYSKEENTPETERPPGASWPFTYTLNADIANGATLQNLLFNDVLPSSLQYVAGSIAITGGTNCVPTVSLPNITVNCSSATGTTADNDVVVTYQAYITDILDESNCAATDVINNASFAPHGPQNASTTISAEHVTMQKGVSPADIVPGDTLTYTVSIQVSDFASVDALLFNDLLPDGLENFQHGSLTHNGAVVPALPPTVTDNGDGTTSIVYDLGNSIAGNIGSGSSLVLTYTADVRNFYNNGDTVKARDPLVNGGGILYGLTAGASGCSNSSSATSVVIEPTINKEIINPQPQYQPGDTVTFRLSMVVPSGDTDGIVFEDFFPLPVFDVDSLDIANFGPGHDIRYAPTDNAQLTASVSIDSAANSLRLDWAGLNSNHPPHTIAVDIDMVVQSDPFADGLHLTNLMQGTTENTAGSPLADLEIIDFNVGAPALVLTTSVSSTS